MNPEAQAAYERMLAKMPEKKRRRYRLAVEQAALDLKRNGLQYDRCETIHRVHYTEEVASKADRDTVGGVPFLCEGFPVPKCGSCGKTMGLNLQFDIRGWFNLPSAEGSHVLAFCCDCQPAEINAYQFSDCDNRLPSSYWERRKTHELYLLPPGSSYQPGELDTFFLPKRLDFFEDTEVVLKSKKQSEDKTFSTNWHCKVGGVDAWEYVNYSGLRCCCGSKMAFLYQTHHFFVFELYPEQHTSKELNFLNCLRESVKLLACEQQCNPRAIIAIADDQRFIESTS
ncbi:Hypothetical protein PBC10988_33570 [Planctomycetales bacterium 10988]|nr:Hypothetical protein PBC10988_33570 [Planctomycetales bacterium 10988]